MAISDYQISNFVTQTSTIMLSSAKQLQPFYGLCTVVSSNDVVTVNPFTSPAINKIVKNYAPKAVLTEMKGGVEI